VFADGGGPGHRGPGSGGRGLVEAGHLLAGAAVGAQLLGGWRPAARRAASSPRPLQSQVAELAGAQRPPPAAELGQLGLDVDVDDAEEVDVAGVAG
jgi:hypothetical protein